MLHINVLELKTVKLALLTFTEQKSLKAFHFQIDNATALLYLVKMGERMGGEGGGRREPNFTEIKQRNLAVSLKTPDHSYCRIPSKFFDCGRNLAVLKQHGPIKMETLTKSFSTSLPEEGNAKKIFVCIKAFSPTTSVLCLETRPFQSGDQCAAKDLGQSFPLGISPILPHSKTLAEIQLRPNRKNVGCHINLTVSNLVPPPTRNVYS